MRKFNKKKVLLRSGRREKRKTVSIHRAAYRERKFERKVVLQLRKLGRDIYKL